MGWLAESFHQAGESLLVKYFIVSFEVYDEELDNEQWPELVVIAAADTANNNQNRHTTSLFKTK